MVAINPHGHLQPVDFKARRVLKVTFQGRGEPEPVLFFVELDKKARKRAKHLLHNYSPAVMLSAYWVRLATYIIDRHTVAIDNWDGNRIDISAAEVASILNTLAYGEIKGQEIKPS